MNLSIFQEILTPFLTVSLISTKINLFVHWYFQRQFGFCWRQSQKKSIFPPRNHYFGVFHIDHHPMHYSITKKHTFSLHVKNIDIKNYAINSATAVVSRFNHCFLRDFFRVSWRFIEHVNFICNFLKFWKCPGTTRGRNVLKVCILRFQFRPSFPSGSISPRSTPEAGDRWRTPTGG